MIFHLRCLASLSRGTLSFHNLPIQNTTALLLLEHVLQHDWFIAMKRYALIWLQSHFLYYFRYIV
jgi:hypothetical protein